MKQKVSIAMSLSVVCFLACTSLLSARVDKAEVKGMIISRTGDILTVKTSSGTVTVALIDETKTKGNKGLIGLRKQHMANTVRIPGLKVDVAGASEADRRIVADRRVEVKVLANKGIAGS